jgi:large subunit ribosomal protein L29
MNGTEVRKLSKEEISAEATRLRKQLFDLRQQLTTDKVEDNSQFKKVRRDVARLLTERSARHVAQKNGGAAPAAPAKKPVAAKKPASKKAAVKG